METIDQLVSELNRIADKADKLKDVSPAILGAVDSIDSEDYPAAQYVITQLQQIQRAINRISAALHPVREAATNQRVSLQIVIGSKGRVEPS